MKINCSCSPRMLLVMVSTVYSFSWVTDKPSRNKWRINRLIMNTKYIYQNQFNIFNKLNK